MYSLFCLCGCELGDITSLFTPRIPEERLSEICEAQGGLKSPGRLAVDGYYQASSSPMFGTEQIIGKLGKNRFQFIEMDTAWVNENNSWGEFNLKKVKGKGKYTRFYLAKRGDPNCEAYEGYIGDARRSAKKKISLRAYGIYPESCVAAIRTDERKGKYRVMGYYKEDSAYPEIIWEVSAVKDLETGENYASYSQFKYCYKGRKKNGSCRGVSKDIFMCKPTVEPYDNPTSSIYNFTLEGTPNPYLKKKLVTKEIHGPFDVPETPVVPELMEKIGGERNIPRVLWDDVRDWYMSREKEGYGYFGARNVSWQENDKRFTSSQYQLLFINDIDRIFYKADITVSRPKLRRYYD